jgi:hypothetical protein
MLLVLASCNDPEVDTTLTAELTSTGPHAVTTHGTARVLPDEDYVEFNLFNLPGVPGGSYSGWLEGGGETMHIVDFNSGPDDFATGSTTLDGDLSRFDRAYVTLDDARCAEGMLE